MLEKFSERDIRFITGCANLIHSIEIGGVEERTLNDFFFMDYQDVEPLYPWERLKSCEEADLIQSNYLRLIGMVQEKFPDMAEEYIPFAVGDLLKEAYLQKN